MREISSLFLKPPSATPARIPDGFHTAAMWPVRSSTRTRLVPHAVTSPKLPPIAAPAGLGGRSATTSPSRITRDASTGLPAANSPCVRAIHDECKSNMWCTNCGTADASIAEATVTLQRCLTMNTPPEHSACWAECARCCVLCLCCLCARAGLSKHSWRQAPTEESAGWKGWSQRRALLVATVK